MKIFALLATVFYSFSAAAQDAAPAVASTAPPAQSGLASFFPLILIFIIFYFLLLRPQSKKMKQHQQMVEALKRGDKVMIAGIEAKVVKVEDSKIDLEIAHGVVIKALKNAITEVISKNDVPVSHENDVKLDKSKK